MYFPILFSPNNFHVPFLQLTSIPLTLLKFMTFYVYMHMYDVYGTHIYTYVKIYYCDLLSLFFLFMCI